MSGNQVAQQGKRSDFLIGSVFHQKTVQSLKAPSSAVDDAEPLPTSHGHACSLISMCNTGCAKRSFSLQV